MCEYVYVYVNGYRRDIVGRVEGGGIGVGGAKENNA